VPDPFIVMCAPNGARRTKADHANIPILPSELAKCAADILEAGASMMHLHVRGPIGEHSLSVERYRAAIKAIQAEVGDRLVVQVTSEAVGIYNRDQQMAMVKELRPEAVSLALRELCPTDENLMSTAAFFVWMRTHDVSPQIILYDQNDVARFDRLRRAGIFGADRPFVLCVLGKYHGEKSENTDLLLKFRDFFVFENIPWAACGFGVHEHDLAAKMSSNGGHVRVGFENNLQRVDGSFAKDNAELVACAVQSAVAGSRAVATASDVRRMILSAD
jgi:uncharacterized protein (DUF849 family)